MTSDHLGFGSGEVIPLCVSGFSFWTSFLRTLRNSLVLAGSLGVISFLSTNKANAQLTIVHNFGDGTVSGDGAYPTTALIQVPDGNFYGSAGATSTESYEGTVYQLTPGGVLTIINRFKNNESNQLLYFKGRLVGTRSGALLDRAGQVFALSEANGNWSVTVWHAFAGHSTEGGNATLILGANGLMYGTTNMDGKGSGTIYKINPATKKLTILYDFPRNSGAGPSSALLEAKDGNFYGATLAETGAEIFKMTSQGAVSKIYTFPSNSFLLGPLVQGADGNFYGCDANQVFQMTSSGAITVLHTFGQGTDGEEPLGVIFGPNGYLYGITEFGGTAKKGTLFELSTDGLTYNVLHNFGDGSIANDGSTPVGGLLLGADNYLYGTTMLGGAANLGTVFKISP
ncbi:MAG: hypothetical protein JOZ08_21775 [Verrucomicrobia bacterium]|nr:hypothetical protein [Verrucomicrobiota bacterium]